MLRIFERFLITLGLRTPQVQEPVPTSQVVIRINATLEKVHSIGHGWASEIISGEVWAYSEDVGFWRQAGVNVTNADSPGSTCIYAEVILCDSDGRRYAGSFCESENESGILSGIFRPL